MKAKAMFLSFAVLAPLYLARAAMRVSVSMLSSRDLIQGKLVGDAVAAPQDPEE